jgi:glutamate transport system permease protein
MSAHANAGPDGGVLYDALGPRGRRRTLICTVAAVAAGLAALLGIGRRLADHGQFASEKWAPLVDPHDESFELLWRFLGGGLWRTVLAAGLAIVISLVLGTALGVVGALLTGRSRWPFTAMIHLLRGIPVVIAIFFAARVLPDLGVDLDILWYVVIGLVVYNSVVIAEILRAGLNALPSGQREAAVALGLSQVATLRLVLLPQAFRIMLPSLISQLVVVMKDTSLGFIVGYEELLRRGNIAIQTTKNPLQMYLAVAIVYIVINASLGRLAEAVEHRMARSRSADQLTPAPGGQSEQVQPVLMTHPVEDEPPTR